MEPISPENLVAVANHSKRIKKVEESAEVVRIDYRQKQSLFMGAMFIFECGLKMDATPITIATATSLFHRFFKKIDMTNYDVYLIGATCVFIAGKVENQRITIRDTINVAYASIHRNAPPLDLAETYFAFKESIFQAELLMMRVFQFKVTYDHPHRYLTHYLKTIEKWIGHATSCEHPSARTAWAMVQDFHHDVSVIEYPPEAIAIAAMTLAFQIYRVKIPLCSDQGAKSWQAILYSDVKPDVQNKIIEKMLGVYELEEEMLLRHAFKGTVSSNGK